ncbi:cytochrome P450 [Burkholderia aenigmatica]|uniref:Cytochrome P450 n=1 Tax=Burkholderia aenigmatica TaxID=2015348 RepID=A0A6P2GSY0_9BURK|nr:cytochrome P450 [Burkholderia aenigmatica]VWB07647.1 cytochrome P450 [Burkholderia aenigmatica]
MQEQTILTALKNGFYDSRIYYETLRSFGGGQRVFFDRYLDGHVVIGYENCKEVARRIDEFGRRSLSLPSDLFSDSRQARSGYEVMQAMSIFLPAGSAYAARRQRLLEAVGHARHDPGLDRIRGAASKSIDLLPADEPAEVFLTSLRPFVARCANLLVLQMEEVPAYVTEDAVTVTYFFDGKRPKREDLIAAMEATDRLADWLATERGLSRSNDAEILADLVLLYVAAHESVSYLLYTCLCHLSMREDGLDDALVPRLASFIAEALRYDSPVQISGRVALDDARIGDYLVRKGEHVYLHVGAANRDDQVFANADVFDENRQPMHLGFGWGPTRCVGSEFAAACATEYLTAFLARFSRVHYHNEQTRFDHGLSARGLKAASFSLGRR